jgi:hypothetical protein
MKKRKASKRLNLSRETLAVLDTKSLAGLAGGAIACPESRVICSIRHTCVSCAPEEPTGNCA